MHLSKKLYVFPLLVFSLFLISGCLSSNTSTNSTNTSLSVSTSTTQALLVNQTNNKSTASNYTFILNKDVQVCLSNSTQSYSQCVAGVAELYNNYTFCNILENQTTQIPQCFAYLAQDLHNSSICLYLNNSADQFSCYSNFTQISLNYTQCINQTNINFTNTCVLYDALQTDNLTLCSYMTNLSMAYSCKDQLLISEKEPQNCQNIIDPTQRQNCFNWDSLATIVVVNTQDPTLCSLMAENTDSANCYNSLANVTQNYNYCSSIQSQSYKDNCLFDSSNLILNSTA